MHILLTGGGSAGHVIPNIAIAEALRVLDRKVRITYIGSTHGLERRLCENAKIPFEAIHTGKLRRYFSVHNFIDLFRVPFGILESFIKLIRLRPNVVFSKGGFVGFPVVLSAWLLGIPVLIHESDAIPGLATKMSAPFAKKIFLGYEDAAPALEKYKNKLDFIGNPVRIGLYLGDAKKGLKWTGFNGERPVLLVMGGSGGSAQLNKIVEVEKKELLKQYDVLHITGEGKGEIVKEENYLAVPFIGEELGDVLAATSIAICRAGANTLAELEALQIPALLYPLGKHASRGDQWANANALCAENPLYRIAEDGKPAMSQLLLLPPRPDEPVKNGSTQKIAFTLLSDPENL